MQKANSSEGDGIDGRRASFELSFFAFLKRLRRRQLLTYCRLLLLSPFFLVLLFLLFHLLGKTNVRCSNGSRNSVKRGEKREREKERREKIGKEEERKKEPIPTLLHLQRRIFVLPLLFAGSSCVACTGRLDTPPTFRFAYADRKKAT